MAQTTHLALFGPVFVAAAPPVACFIDYHLPLCIYYKHQLASKKMKKKKTHLWPIFVATTPPIMHFVDYIYIYTKCQLFSKKIRKKKKLTCCPNDMQPTLPCCCCQQYSQPQPITNYSLVQKKKIYNKKKTYQRLKTCCILSP